MKKGCHNCKANFEGLCLVWGTMALNKDEIADNFECKYWKLKEPEDEK